jgi:DNA-binding CsgD family transcriptional regulator
VEFTGYEMLLSYISFLTFCSSIVMGIIGIKLDAKSRKNISFAVFSFIVAVWALGDTFYYIASDKTSGWFWYRITSIGWCGLIFGIFYICTEFAGYYKKIPLIVKILFFLYSISLMIIQFRSTLFVKDFDHTPNGLIEKTDIMLPGFLLLYGGLSVSIAVGVFFIIKAIINTKSNREKKLLTFSVYLCFLCSLMGMGSNILQSLLPHPLPPLGSVFMLFLIAGVLYLMQKYKILQLNYNMIPNETFDVFSDFIIMISPDKCIININESVKKALNTGEGFFGLFNDINQINVYIDESVGNMTRSQKQIIFLKGKDGENILSNVIIYPVFDKFQDYTGSIIIGKPLSEFENIACEYKISPQEKRIILLLREGLINKEIAIKMQISDGVIKNYIYNIYRKTNVNNRVELLQLFFPIES